MSSKTIPLVDKHMCEFIVLLVIRVCIIVLYCMHLFNMTKCAVNLFHRRWNESKAQEKCGLCSRWLFPLIFYTIGTPHVLRMRPPPPPTAVAKAGGLTNTRPLEDDVEPVLTTRWGPLGLANCFAGA